MTNVLRSLNNKQSTRTVLALVDQLVISGTRFVASWMIARYCGAEQLGYFALGFSGLVLIDLVLQAFVTAPFSIFSQRLSEYRLHRYTGDAVLQSGVVGAFGLVVFAVIGTIAGIAGVPWLSSVMFVSASVVPACVLREFTRRYCFATEQVGFALVIDSLFAAMHLGLMIALLECERLNSVTAHAASGLACGLSLLVWFAARRGRIVFSFARWRVSAKKHWRFGQWVFVSQAMNQLNWNIVQWMIAFWLSTEATGVFTGCLAIAFLSNPFVLGLANVIYPRLALIRNIDGSKAMRRLAGVATLAIGVVMTLFTLGLLAAGQLVCDILYADPAYAHSGLLPAILAAAVSCLAITMPLDGGLWAERRTDLSSASSGIGLAVTTMAVAVLVHWGTTAAALGLLTGCIFEVTARIVFFLRCPSYTKQFNKLAYSV